MKWIWKDGKGGYSDLLKQAIITPDCFSSVNKAQATRIQQFVTKEKRIDRNFTHWCLQYENNHVLNSWQIQTTITDLKYENEIWYCDIWRLITLSQYPPNSDKIEQRRLLNKSSKYMILKDELFKSVGHGNWRRCVTKSEVAEILQLAHDFGGHYVHTLTMKKLSKYWWPDKSKNCYKYILGCLECAEHGTKRRSETKSPVYVDQPNVLMGMDFIGPFPNSDLTIDEILNLSYPHVHIKRNKWTVLTPESFETNNVDVPRNPRVFATFSYVLLVVDYFTKFVNAFATVGDDSDEVIRCHTWLFNLKGSPIAMYTDPSPHFESAKTQRFLTSFNVLWTP